MATYTIYLVKNLCNDKCYVGFDSNWPRRKASHLALSKSNSGFRLHEAIRKYGKENFEWSILYQLSNNAYSRHQCMGV